MNWRFGESDNDGIAWLNNPSELSGFIDVQSSQDHQWRRIMVVTRSWVEQQLSAVRPTSGRLGRAIFASMLVVPDGSPDELRQSIAAAVAEGGVEHFAASLSD